MHASRYRSDAHPDYSHRFHAGNVGDVWKHVALIAVLRAVAGGTRRMLYLDTHAGEGQYHLASSGEWSEGIGRLWTQADGAGVLADYLALCRRLGRGADRPEIYPGSPAFARAVLGDEARMWLWEIGPHAAARLGAHLADDRATRLTTGNALPGLRDALAAAEREADRVVVLIDPSWHQKSDWVTIPDALARAVASTPGACVLLWYPVKSLTRPNAMVARLQAAGVSGTIAELVTTPLGTRRNRLNGSGVLLINAPPGAIEAIAAAAPRIGGACATQDGTWSLRVSAFGARSAG